MSGVAVEDVSSLNIQIFDLTQTLAETQAAHSVQRATSKLPPRFMFPSALEPKAAPLATETPATDSGAP